MDGSISDKWIDRSIDRSIDRYQISGYAEAIKSAMCILRLRGSRKSHHVTRALARPRGSSHVDSDDDR
jgi:hypothetical protein